MKKQFRSLLCGLLITILCVLQIPVHAVDITSPSFTPATSDEETVPSGKIVKEIVALRESNVKHFELDDGTYQAIVYGRDVHFMANGQWEDVDNTLSLRPSDGRYQTADNRVRFAGKGSSGDHLDELSENGYSIAMSWLGTKAAVAEKLSLSPSVSVTHINEESKTANEASASALTKKSSLRFQKVSSNIDLEYKLIGRDIKENIIVHAPSESYQYDFFLELGGLVPAMQEDGSVLLLNAVTKQPEYAIPAPYMYDAAGTVSHSVSYRIASEKGGFRLSVIADPAWMNAAERAYPVTVDPIIESVDYPYDTYISSESPYDNFGTEEYMRVSETDIAYVLIFLPDFPEGASVNNALLKFYCYGETNQAQDIILESYQVLQDWSETGLTWNSLLNTPNQGLDSSRLSRMQCFIPANASPTDPRPGSLNITEAARAWHESRFEEMEGIYHYGNNLGIGIKYSEENTEENAEAVRIMTYESGEYCPYLQIYYSYVLPSGVYAIKNQGSSNRYMSVDTDASGEAFTGRTMEHKYVNADIDAEPQVPNIFTRESLFKITLSPNSPLDTNCYIIRSMLDNSISFGLQGQSYVTKQIPISDEDVSLSDTFVITWSVNSFTIHPYGQSTYLSVGSLTDPSLHPCASSAITAKAKWTFATPQSSDAQIEGPNDIIPGGTATYKLSYTWSTSLDPLELETDSDGISVASWDPDSQELHITVDPDAELYSQITVSTVAAEKQIDVVPVQSGEYYIRCSNLHWGLDSNGNPSLEDVPVEGVTDDGIHTNYGSRLSILTATSGTAVALRAFDVAQSQKWEITYFGDHQYTIRVVGGKYLNAADGLINLDDLSDEGGDSLKWSFSAHDNGWVIRNAAKGETLTLATLYSSGDGFQNNSNLGAVNMVNCNWNYRNVWSFYPANPIASENGTISYLCTEEGDGHYHQESAAFSMELADKLDYNMQFNVHPELTNSDSTLPDAYWDDEEILSIMQSSQIFVFRGHGTRVGETYGSIEIIAGGGLLYQDRNTLSSEEIQSLEGSDPLSGCELILFSACCSGHSPNAQNPGSMVAAAYEKGAKCVIGFVNSVDCDIATKFTNCFLEHYSGPDSIRDAIYTAVEKSGIMTEGNAEQSPVGDIEDYITLLSDYDIEL